MRGQQRADADSSKALTPTDQENELAVRYAQAYLKLMEATLGKYEEMNQRQRNTIRPTVIQAIQEAVAKARERVQLAQSDDANDSQIYVLRAEAELRLVDESLRQADAVNKRLAGTVSAREVERLKSERDFAKIKVEKARHLATGSPLSNVRFELDQLREDVQDLRLIVALLRAGRG